MCQATGLGVPGNRSRLCEGPEAGKHHAVLRNGKEGLKDWRGEQWHGVAVWPLYRCLSISWEGSQRKLRLGFV